MAKKKAAKKTPKKVAKKATKKVVKRATKKTTKKVVKKATKKTAKKVVKKAVVVEPEEGSVVKLSYKDFNAMNDKELRALPGVGKNTAKNIVGMRPFRSSDDLFKVKGLGKNTLLKVGIEKTKKKRKKWIDIDGTMYPHYTFAFHEVTGAMDFFWRIPKEFRLYYGREEESKELTAKYREEQNIKLEKL